MRSTLSTTWTLILGMGLLMFGGGLQGTLISLRATLEGFPAAITGIVMSCYYLGFLGGTRLAPHFVQRVGHIRVFAAFCSMASASILLQAMFINPLIWGLLRLASGVCFAGIYVVAESWLNDRASSQNRGRLLAIYMVVIYVGLGASQFLLNLADPRGPELFILISVLISISLVPMALSVQPAPEIKVPQKVPCRELFRYSPLGLVAVAISGASGAILFSLGSVYARMSGLNTAGVATFMGLSILATVLTQYPVGRLSDRLDRRSVIAGVCLLTSVVAAAIAILDRMPYPLLLALGAVFGGFMLTLYSLAVSHINDHLQPAQMVGASSSLILVNGIAAAIGPVVAGTLMGHFGAQAYFGTLAVLLGTLAIYDVWRKLRRGPVPAEQKGRFIGAEPQTVSGQTVASAAQDKP